MNCCQCQGIEDIFNERSVAKELRNYRAKGPDKTTRMMVEAIKTQGVNGFHLLDIGGGVGAIQHALIEAGVNEATDIDASKAYLNAAMGEAKRQGISNRIQFQYGNFVDLAPQIAPAEIVTLDRVVCCYPDMENLVSLSAARAEKLYGLVYPRDTWWIKAAAKLLNFFFSLKRDSFRTFIHSTEAVDRLVRKKGLQPHFWQKTLVWQVVVYKRIDE